MDLNLIIIIIFILFIGSLIHSSVGFGFPLIATPLLALFIDIQSAVFFTLIPTLLLNIVSITSSGNLLIAFKKYYPLAIYTTLGSAFGTLILLHCNNNVFFKYIIVFSILIYLFFDFSKKSLNIANKKSHLITLLFGLGSGLLGGLTNAMGPLLLIYTLEMKLSKNSSIQATNICFLFGKIIQIFLFAENGNFNEINLKISILSLLIVFITFFLGKKIKNKIVENTYKKIIKFFLLLIAISILIQLFFN